MACLKTLNAMPIKLTFNWFLSKLSILHYSFKLKPKKMQQVKTWPCIVHLVKKIYQIILNFGTHMAWLYIPWGLNMWHFESRWLLSFFSLQSINFNLLYHFHEGSPSFVSIWTSPIQRSFLPSLVPF
jgi:hypothetical protein